MELNNTKIYFPGNTSDIISIILQNYGLEESDEELEKKIFKKEGSFLNGGLILETAIEIVRKNITYNEAITNLQKQLNISQNIAEQLVNDIKTKLVSLATTQKPISSAMGVVEMIKKNNTIMDGPNSEKEPGDKNALPLKKPEKIKKSATKTPTSQIRQSTKPDNYREPIE